LQGAPFASKALHVLVSWLHPVAQFELLMHSTQAWPSALQKGLAAPQ
jgi:hypothetical protein